MPFPRLAFVIPLRRPLRKNTIPSPSVRTPYNSRRLVKIMSTPAVTRNPGDMIGAVNVLGTPLALHSLSPPTGFFRNGFCDTNASDIGSHTVAGILTGPFLSFTASRGNDLRRSGLTPGCRWCLCVSRWKEAYEAYKAGKIPRDAVPRVVLEATHQRAVDKAEGSAKSVDVGMLKEFAGV
ncbi:hypothetical protein EX30DRAFT_394768 [Ascodesmis nigricans]|uniref:Uncharacterized protein n=1 Tax=Ascodesmis nigricans TaxID=341454 RepID=A0A4V3SJ34_9PEZI|nr:hypothetical protein EX30DRAFT_394768 [Ascodesmis nigricans]